MGAYRGHSPNFLDVVRRLFRGGPPNKCQGAKMYPRTKRGDTINYQLAWSRLLGHTSVPRQTLSISRGEGKSYIYCHLTAIFVPVSHVVYRHTLHLSFKNRYNRHG